MTLKFDVLAYMRRGSSFLKYGRHGFPHFRFVFLDEDSSRLYWFSSGKKISKCRGIVPVIFCPRHSDSLTSLSCVVDLTASAQLILGQQTRTFVRNKTPDLERLSFSIQWGSEPDQTLDLVATDQNDFNIWTVGLRTLLEKVRTHNANEMHMMEGGSW